MAAFRPAAQVVGGNSVDTESASPIESPPSEHSFLSKLPNFMNGSFFCRFSALMICLLSVACVQNSTVVRVRKDGKGEVFVRFGFSPQLVTMMKTGAMPGGVGVQAGGKALDPTAPDEAMLRAQAAAMGEGVRFLGAQKETTKAGWEGFVAVYGFDDINTLQVKPGDSNQINQVMGQETEGADTRSPLTFSLADGTLKIHIPAEINDPEAIAKEMAQGQGGEEKMKPDQLDAALPMMASMMAGLRMGVFVRIDGEIAETNASHVSGMLLTISDADIGEMIKDPAFIKVMKTSMGSEKPDPAEVQRMMADLQAANGFKIETKPEVSVRFK